MISGTVGRVADQFALGDLQVGWFTSAALVGCIAGALAAGWLGDRFGRKPNLIAAAVLFFVSALFSALPPGFSGLIAARIFVGEVWRGMFAAEMLPALMFFVLLFFVPESPRWLIKSGAVDDGLHKLTRISGAETARRELAEIQHSLANEEGSLAELFRPGLRRALLVGVMFSVFGQLSGVNIVVYYGPKILAAFAFPWYVATFGMHAGFFTAAAICLVATAFFWKFVPETKGRSLEDIENLWQTGARGRNSAI